MKKWQILKQTDVSPSKWFPISRHTVQLPNGTVLDDFFLSPMGDVAMVLAVTTEGEIVLVRQYKHGVGEVTLELPGGFRQAGKSIEDSALAELEEETGIRTTPESLRFLGRAGNVPTKMNLVTHCFLAEHVEFNSVQKLDETEAIEVMCFAPRKVLEMVKDGEIWTADTVTAISLALLRHPQLFA
jgi:ADP-ribose pyrophosphatase YjhB (NUDIX family)